jgi:hypothetical protein
MAKATEIAAMAGQKILFSGRGSAICSELALSGPSTKPINGDTIKAKTHAEIETIAHLSIIEVEDLARFNSKECIEALDILAGTWRPRWMPLATLNTFGRKSQY